MTRIPFILLSTSDGSPLTGATPSVTISKDGAAFTAATNTPAEIGNGYYYIDLTTAETTVTNNVIVRATATWAQPTAVVWEPEQAIPTAADNATAVWGAQTKEVTIATTQAETFATASSVANIATTAGAIKAKTDTIPANIAVQGAQMSLTNETIANVKDGLATATDLSNAEDTIIGNIVSAMPDVTGLSTFDPTTDDVTINATQAATLATAAALTTVGNNVSAVKAKTDNLPANPAAQGTQMSLTNEAIAAVKNGLATSSDLSALETHGDSSWATATGFATPSDLSGLSTFNAATDTVTIDATQAAGMQTATGFATPSDIPSSSDNASAVWSANSRTLTESVLTAADVWSYSSRTLTASALTAQDVWEYTARTLTSSPTDISSLATKTDLATAENAIIQAIPDVSGLSTFDPATDKVTLNDTEDGTLSAMKTKVDTLHNTDLTGIATSKNVSDAQTAIIGAMPNDYAKAGDSMTLTSATVNSIKSGLATPETVWAYTSRTLTEEIAVSITTEDINNICAGVWGYVPRRLTSIVSDVIEPNKP